MIFKFASVIVIFISFVACATEINFEDNEYVLDLECTDKGLLLELSKRGYTVPEKINLRSSIGASNSYLNELSFKILDNEGRQYDYLPQKGSSKPNSDYFMVMHVDTHFGILVDFDRVELNYQLKPSSYIVQAFYKNLHISDLDKYDEIPLESNLINLIVNENGYQCGRTTM